MEKLERAAAVLSIPLLWIVTAPGATGAPLATPTGAPLATPTGARAAAWVLRASLQSGQHVIEVADVHAQAGGSPSGSAVPALLDTAGPSGAVVSPTSPSASSAQIDWHDPTGSLTAQGGFAAASLASGGATARAGIAAGSGSSFTIASKLLTWQQQQQLTTEVAALNDAVFRPLNGRLQALAPQLAALGIVAPTFQEMTPVALINVGSGKAATASASTATAPGFASAQAEADLSSIDLLDGFIQLSAISSTASALAASATIGEIRLAGVPVRADQTGIIVAENDVFSRSLLQPLVDLVVQSLAADGITLRIDETSSRGSVQEATALELDVATPTGLDQVSVGHAEALAEAAAAPAVNAAPPPTSPPVQSGGPVTATPSPAGVLSPLISPLGLLGLPPVVPSASQPTANSRRPGIPAFLGDVLPRNAARALGSAFLVVLLGGLAAAAFPALLMGLARRRSAPTISPSSFESEVRP
jgi:hypothetical protein